MKKLLLSILLILVSFNTYSYQMYSASGVSDTQVLVNGATGAPLLKQDLINNANSGQPNRTFNYTFGRNGLVQNVLCDLWDGPTCTYVFPATAQQMAISSSSASDTLAGVGVQKIIIHYLDNLYHVQSEIVSMNGTTPVNTVATNILRVNSMHAYQQGSSATAVGNISLKNTGGTVTYSYLIAGASTARQAIFTVPAAKYGYISHWQASSGTVTGTHFTAVRLRATSHEGVLLPGVFLVIDEVGTLNGGYNITLPIPIRVPPTTDLKMSAISDASNANAVTMGTIMGWYEDQ
jgi:hypothetical protein